MTNRSSSMRINPGIRHRATVATQVVARTAVVIATVIATATIALTAGVQNPVLAEADLTMPLPVDIGTCKNLCPAKGIQFRPGQRITVRVVNRTRNFISIENLTGAKPIVVSGLKAIEFSKGGSSDPNPSIAMWEKNETPLSAKLSQPKPDLLVIELRFAARKPGDQSVYLRNDGKVDIF